MALATKCPHCSTIFRVAHDQLKLRGGIVRCGSCNEVFDGNAALLEPLAAPEVAPAFTPAAAPVYPAATDLAPAPPTPPFEAPQDNRATEEPGDAPIYTLELDSALDAPDGQRTEAPAAAIADAWPQPETEIGPAAVDDESPADDVDDEPPADDVDDEPPADAVDDEPPAAPVDDEPPANAVDDEPPAGAAPQPEPQPEQDNPLDIKPLTHEELEAALAAELALMEESLAADAAQAGPAPSADTSERREPTLDPDARYDLDETDEEALVQLAAARERDTAPGIHTLLRAASAPPQDRFEAQAVHSVETPEPAAKEEEVDDPNEPGFVKRDRRRERRGKTIAIAMGLGSLLLVGALVAQGLTTFRNQLAASYPALKPTLQDICATLGCKIELPAQIDQLVIEQGELQTLSETTFSFSTLLRNQGATAQAWPHIELVLDDANDKAILRRVFTPRDYLGADVALEKGFAPRSEQSVKLYFELKQLKASGYHIAVFYP